MSSQEKIAEAAAQWGWSVAAQQDDWTRYRQAPRFMADEPPTITIWWGSGGRVRHAEVAVPPTRTPRQIIGGTSAVIATLAMALR